MTSATGSIAQTFPDATDAPVPESLGKLFRARLRASMGRNFILVVAWVILQVAFPLMLLDLGLVPWAVGIAAFAAIWAVVYLWRHHSRAEDTFWEAYCSARGLSDRGGSLHAACPLYSKGDKRRFERVLTGRMGQHEGCLAHYTYTEVTYTDEGRKSETHYHFTVVQMQLPEAVANRYRGVYLRPNSISFGRLQDALSHDREVRLESAPFNKRYDLRVLDDQDDIALYELFSTPFVQALATGPEIWWEQREADLVVFRKGHEASVRELDELVANALVVCDRYREEHM